MSVVKILFIAMLVSLTANCSIYKMNINQGNFVEQKDIDKIRKGMTKDQIMFVLGRPLIQDTFGDDVWFYLHTTKHGKTDKKTRKELQVIFENNQVVALKGDFEAPENFEGEAI